MARDGPPAPDARTLQAQQRVPCRRHGATVGASRVSVGRQLSPAGLILEEEEENSLSPAPCPLQTHMSVPPATGSRQGSSAAQQATQRQRGGVKGGVVT